MYECHVTTEYLGEDVREIYERMAKTFGFKMGNLYMKKDEKSELDSFFTSHHGEFSVIKRDMVDFIMSLKGLQIRVIRYKIEEILLDSKYQNDPLGIL